MSEQVATKAVAHPDAEVIDATKLALGLMGELARAGKGRSAAAIVARRLAVDSSNETEVWNLAQRFRRLRRAKI